MSAATKVPATAQEWLDADMQTLAKLREDDRETYDRLAAEAIQLSSRRPDPRRRGQ